jgi:hypothetical protein
MITGGNDRTSIFHHWRVPTPQGNTPNKKPLFLYQSQTPSHAASSKRNARARAEKRMRFRKIHWVDPAGRQSFIPRAIAGLPYLPPHPLLLETIMVWVLLPSRPLSTVFDSCASPRTHHLLIQGVKYINDSL